MDVTSVLVLLRSRAAVRLAPALSAVHWLEALEARQQLSESAHRFASLVFLTTSKDLYDGRHAASACAAADWHVNSFSQIKHRRMFWPTTQNTLPTRSSGLMGLFFSTLVSGC